MPASDPVALLVGAGDAIGAAVARRCAAGGLKVCIARRDAAKSQAVVDEIAAKGGWAHAFGVDARREGAVQDLFATVERDAGPIALCLFNAGSNVNTPLTDTSASLFQKAWELACYAGFLTGREAARYMVPRAKGTILFTGATASLRGGTGYAAFASAKFGLRAVAQATARELGPKNIHVAHLIIDSGVDTEWVRQRRIEALGPNALDDPDLLMPPSSVAESYWLLYQQPKSAWTFELEIRPFGEKW